MGNTLGRAIRSSHKRPLDPAVAAQALSIKEKEAAHAAVLQANIARAPPAEVDLPEDNGDQLRQLVRAIESRPLDLYKDSKDVAAMKRRRVTKEQKEAALIGRLDTVALRAALEDVLRFEREGKDVDMSQLAKKYEANEQVLQKTLAHCGLAPVEQAPDGRLVARAKIAWQREQRST